MAPIPNQYGPHGQTRHASWDSCNTVSRKVGLILFVFHYVLVMVMSARRTPVPGMRASL